MCLYFFTGSEELERDVEFEVVGEAPDKAPPPQPNQEEVNNITNGNKDSAQPSTSSKGQQERKPFFFSSYHSMTHGFLYRCTGQIDPSARPKRYLFIICQNNESNGFHLNPLCSAVLGSKVLLQGYHT